MKCKSLDLLDILVNNKALNMNFNIFLGFIVFAFFIQLKLLYIFKNIL